MTGTLHIGPISSIDSADTHLRLRQLGKATVGKTTERFTPSRKARKEKQLQVSRKAAKRAKKIKISYLGHRPMQNVTFSGIQWIQKR